MDPLLWDAIQSLRSCRNQQSVNNNSMYNASVTDSDQNSYHEFSGYTADKSQSSATGSEEWEGPSSSSYDLYNQESEAEDPDGEPLLVEDEDPELARKRKELREIEERIKQKKVSIALKTVEHIVNNVTEAPSTNGELDECEGPTLRERVHAILQHHHPDSFRSKAHMPPKGILKSSSLSKLHGDHPLKLRVKNLMKQRLDDPFVFSTYEQVPDITPPPPARRETSAEKETSSTDLGFQRFLSILNKGVDMEMLSKIVNAKDEDLPVEDKLEPLGSKRQVEDRSLRSESKESRSGASLPNHRCTSSRERKTSQHSQERSLSERLSLPSDEKKRNGRGDHCSLSRETSLPSHSPTSSTSSAERKINLHSQERSLNQKLSSPQDEVKNNQADRCFASSSRSRSPPALKKKKKEKSPKVDDHRKQLQNILQTLGLSLEVEEMSKLTDRTQERLYGKKRSESREEQESQQRGPHKHHKNSSSSSSSSSSRSSSFSSSGSESRSPSPSPSRRRLSHNRDFKEHRTPERSRSKDRHRDELSNYDSKQDDKKTLRHRGRDREHTEDFFTHENPDSHQPIPTYSAHNTPGYPAYTDYPFPQYSQYGNYQNAFNSVTNSHWMGPQYSHAASFYPMGYSHQQAPFHHFSDPSPVLIKLSNHDKGSDFSVNPDLAQSEGQDALACRSRCLRVVSTERTASYSRVKPPPKGRNMGNTGIIIQKKSKSKKKKKKKAKWNVMEVNKEREEARKMEEARWMEEAKRIKETRKNEEAKTNEEARRLEEARRIEEARRMEEAKRTEEALRVGKEDSETEQSKKEKQAPTEEEIKKNLRKMLAAFNRKPKPNVVQPPKFISCETE